MSRIDLPPELHDITEAGVRRRAIAWVNSEIDYYAAYARANYIGYRACAMPIIVLGAIIPIVALTTTNHAWITALLGALIAILEATQHLFRFRENWLTSVATRDRLVREREMFFAGAGVYAQPENAKLTVATFAEQAAAAMSAEAKEWMDRQHKGNQRGEGGWKAPTDGSPDGIPVGAVGEAGNKTGADGSRAAPGERSSIVSDPTASSRSADRR